MDTQDSSNSQNQASTTVSSNLDPSNYTSIIQSNTDSVPTESRQYNKRGTLQADGTFSINSNSSNEVDQDITLEFQQSLAIGNNISVTEENSVNNLALSVLNTTSSALDTTTTFDIQSSVIVTTAVNTDPNKLNVIVGKVVNQLIDAEKKYISRRQSIVQPLANYLLSCDTQIFQIKSASRISDKHGDDGRQQSSSIIENECDYIQASPTMENTINVARELYESNAQPGERIDKKMKEFILSLCNAISTKDESYPSLVGSTITKVRDIEARQDKYNLGWLKPAAPSTLRRISGPALLLLASEISSSSTTKV
jgi:hypothetical protein